MHKVRGNRCQCCKVSSRYCETARTCCAPSATASKKGIPVCMHESWERTAGLLSVIFPSSSCLERSNDEMMADERARSRQWIDKNDPNVIQVR